jgi:hypothetical protein
LRGFFPGTENFSSSTRAFWDDEPKKPELVTVAARRGRRAAESLMLARER